MNADMQEFHARRLLDQAEFMTRLTSNRISMGNWFKDNTYEAGNVLAASLTFESDDGVESIPACGTTACVLGWTGLRSKFRKIGLVTTPSAGVHFTPTTVADVQYEKAWRKAYFAGNGVFDRWTWNNAHYKSLISASLVFGLSPDETESLFATCSLLGGHECQDLAFISRKMKEFVKTKFPHLVKDV